jgi:hypothetical protein
MCVDCGRVLVLTAYSIDRKRWSWTAEDPPETDVKAATSIVRTLLGLDAALAELGVFAGPVRGLA